MDDKELQSLRYLAILGLSIFIILTVMSLLGMFT